MKQIYKSYDWTPRELSALEKKMKQRQRGPSEAKRRQARKNRK